MYAFQMFVFLGYMGMKNENVERPPLRRHSWSCHVVPQRPPVDPHSHCNLRLATSRKVGPPS